jgi:chemotaxis protein methyltransferase CheR
VRITTDPVQNIAALLQHRTGLCFDGDRRELLRRQAGMLRRELGVSSLAELYLRLGAQDRTGHAALGRLVERVTVNHTKFLREPAVLERVCEDLVERHARESEIRVWSAASASGEELYSVVLLLANQIGLPALRMRWKFLGTDISQEMVQEAEQGTYSANRVSNVPSTILARHFRRTRSGTYRINKDIRSLCIFRRFNLTSPQYPFRQGFHLVLCRNVLYYLDEKARRRVLQSIYSSVTEGGLLVTSLSESISSLNTSWTQLEPCIHAKRSLQFSRSGRALQSTGGSQR